MCGETMISARYGSVGGHYGQMISFCRMPRKVACNVPGAHKNFTGKMRFCWESPVKVALSCDGTAFTYKREKAGCFIGRNRMPYFDICVQLPIRGWKTSVL